MLLIRKPGKRVVELREGCVATIGAYDGLHIGHRRILERVLTVAREKALPALVFSFEPTPKEFFSRAAPPARLMRFREKFEALQEMGFDVFFCPRFNAGMAGLEPDEFIDRLLADVLNVKHLVVGDDFQFAHRRSGTVKDLRRRGSERGFSLEQVGSVIEDGERISSSVVRHALQAGDLIKAKQLLGRGYRMSGQVIRGNQLGRTLGMPTANVRLNRPQSPVLGIYAVRVGGLEEGRWLDGVASVGTRPTIGGVEPLLEVHLFDFDRDIYGAHIQVEFVAKLRDEVRFADLDALSVQMDQDALDAQDMLSRIPADA
jgi:riboflavin kinase/FMN adenylyltransferase